MVWRTRVESTEITDCEFWPIPFADGKGQILLLGSVITGGTMDKDSYRTRRRGMESVRQDRQYQTRMVRIVPEGPAACKGPRTDYRQAGKSTVPRRTG